MEYEELSAAPGCWLVWIATSAEVFDVAVDIRKSSPTFGQWVGGEWVGVNLSVKDQAGKPLREAEIFRSP